MKQVTILKQHKFWGLIVAGAGLIENILANRHPLFKGFLSTYIAGYIALSFPYPHVPSILMLFVIISTTVLGVTYSLRFAGCYQSIIAFSMALVGLFLLHINLSIKWMLVIFAIASIGMLVNSHNAGRLVNHDITLFDFDNKVYISLATFGLFQVATQFYLL